MVTSVIVLVGLVCCISRRILSRHARQIYYGTRADDEARDRRLPFSFVACDLSFHHGRCTILPRLTGDRLFTFVCVTQYIYICIHISRIRIICLGGFFPLRGLLCFHIALVVVVHVSLVVGLSLHSVPMPSGCCGVCGASL